ncbi:MAG: hypothetical protein IJR99_02545 [Kiritimatiellae bacterium]|nr:hypothetical protein [Kiritimatiellia bacterium]
MAEGLNLASVEMAKKLIAEAVQALRDPSKTLANSPLKAVIESLGALGKDGGSLLNKGMELLSGVLGTAGNGAKQGGGILGGLLNSVLDPLTGKGSEAPAASSETVSIAEEAKKTSDDLEREVQSNPEAAQDRKDYLSGLSSILTAVSKALKG